MFFRRLCTAYFCLYSFQLTAQSLAENKFAHYTTASGLSHNTVTGLAQDSAGYLWIATAMGLNRFDGSRFVQFHSTSDSISLPSEEINQVTWLKKDLLAVYSLGLHIINTRTGERHNLFVPYHRQQWQYKFNGIVRALGDDDGNIFVLTGSGFYHFDKFLRLLSRFDYYSEAEVPVAYFVFGRDLFVLDKQRLLVVSADGFYIYNKRSKNIKKPTAEDVPLLNAFLPRPISDFSFFQPSDGRLFVSKVYSDSLYYIDFSTNKTVVSRLPFTSATNGFHWRSRLACGGDTLLYLTAQENGFYKMRFNPKTGKVQLFPHLYFADHQCLELLRDRDQKLWVATTKGLFREDEGRSQVASALLPASVTNIYPNTVFDGLYVTKDKILAGTRSPGNLLLYDKKSLRFTAVTDMAPFRKKFGGNYNIYKIESINSSRLIMSANGLPLLVDEGGTRLNTLSLPHWSTGSWTSEVYKDSKGILWIASTNVYRYSPQQGVISVIPADQLLKNGVAEPENIREDGEGNVWMTRNGLSRYNVLQDRFDRRLDSFPFIKMPDKQVKAMEIDKKRNTMWIASHNNGLLAYNITKGVFRHFTTADGLPDNNLTALALVGDRLWMAATTNLACLDLRTLKITGYGKEDGFPDMPIISRADFFYDSTSQQLYLPFSKSIVRFNPEQLLQKKSPPHVFIESVAVSGQQTIYLPVSKVTTSWKNSDITLTIGSINFSDPISQRYAYRTPKEAGTPWTELGTLPSFSISSLSPGTHRIQVKVYSLTNRWPERVKEITVEVKPPLWLTDWFFVLTGTLLLVMLAIFIKWRTRRARRQEREKTNIERLKADHYKSQFELEQITSYFSSSLADKKKEDEVLWDVAKNLIGKMNYEDCLIYLWNEAKTRMVQKAAHGPKGAPEVIAADAFEVEPGQGIVGHVIQTCQPLLVNDTRMDSRYRVDDSFRLSEVAVPIIHNGELLGVIDSEHSQANSFSERDIKILTTIATLLGNKLKQIASEQSLEAKQQELANINTHLAEARLSALQAQMNPHFVFNALNSIKRMILDGDNDKASRYLSKFALMIRMTLEHSKEVFVSLNDNIEYLQNYLAMEQLRFGDSFAYTITIDEALDAEETLIPSMMIQPLVENAIWHGLMQSEKEKHISISFSMEQNTIVCRVEDNGIGLQRSEALRAKQRPLHRSVGLENLQKRIRIINEKYDTACDLQITDLGGNGDSGTRAVLQWNLITTYQKT